MKDLESAADALRGDDSAWGAGPLPLPVARDFGRKLEEEVEAALQGAAQSRADVEALMRAGGVAAAATAAKVGGQRTGGAIATALGAQSVTEAQAAAVRAAFQDKCGREACFYDAVTGRCKNGASGAHTHGGLDAGAAKALVN